MWAEIQTDKLFGEREDEVSPGDMKSEVPMGHLDNVQVELGTYGMVEGNFGVHQRSFKHESRWGHLGTGWRTKKESARGRTLENRSILTQANTEGQVCLASSYRLPISLLSSYGFYLCFLESEWVPPMSGEVRPHEYWVPYVYPVCIVHHKYLLSSWSNRLLTSSPCLTNLVSFIHLIYFLVFCNRIEYSQTKYQVHITQLLLSCELFEAPLRPLLLPLYQTHSLFVAHGFKD